MWPIRLRRLLEVRKRLVLNDTGPLRSSTRKVGGIPLHELGIMIQVVKTVEKFAMENGITKIDTLVLQIGELSSVIPRYIQACYPAAVDGTLLEDTKLEIKIIPGNCRCFKCNKIFNYIKNQGECPECGSRDFELLSGREFMIKEIVAC
ncbi:hydrogenase nickel incorporation protein HypA/HybF [Tepidimicrobium xylanilyticum]|uniref:Hydrogenase maturation factor HypA n=1 Tax=Tepidimicrobium xylanilyticum TaxID=1123352 RepID=A0A1H2TEW2_9FIRM|nr:hydrogenase nickel incorporation protein HypA/HybF [Tepidimicrobium xylanilyticum]